MMTPYLALEPSWRAAKLESLDRVLRRLVVEVSTEHTASIEHCIAMLHEAYPDPVER